MYFTTSKTTIKCKIDQVYFAVKDVTLWPKIFPPCQSVEVLKEDGDTMEMRISALTKGKLYSWSSRRVADNDNKVIYFEQFETVKPLTVMKGKWECIEKGDCTEVHLHHQFNHSFHLLKSIIALVIRVFFVDANSKKELDGLRKYLEREEGIEVFS